MARRTGGVGVGPGQIYITGLTDLNKALREIDPALQKELRTAFRRIAQKVRDIARARMPVRSGRARTSVRAASTSKGAYVASGKASVPYVAWLDFGGALKPVGQRRNTQMRPVIRGGRYLYPAVAKFTPQAMREAVAAVEKAKARAGLR